MIMPEKTKGIQMIYKHNSQDNLPSLFS